MPNGGHDYIKWLKMLFPTCSEYMVGMRKLPEMTKKLQVQQKTEEKEEVIFIFFHTVPAVRP